MKLADRMQRLGTESAFAVGAKVAGLERSGRRIIKFHIGQPDFPTPGNIKEAAKKALDANHTGYTEAHGIHALREEVCREFRRTRGVSYSPEEIVVTPGGKPILFEAAFALLQEGDEAIVPNPSYPIYASATQAMGAKPVYLPLLEETGFSFDHEKLKSLVSSKTRLFFLNSPANPTGGVLSRDDLKLVRDLAVEKDFFVLSDEVYSRFVYDGHKHETIAAFEGMKERLILMDAFSKSYAMTGWRLGYAGMPLELAKRFSTLAINIYSGPANFTQHAGIEALAGPQESVARMVAEFDRRRKIIVAGLNAISGVSCTMPKGAFYAFPNVKKILRARTSDELESFLLEKHDVSVLSGTAFGSLGEGYIRLSYATGENDIKEGLSRLEKAFPEF